MLLATHIKYHLHSESSLRGILQKWGIKIIIEKIKISLIDRYLMKKIYAQLTYYDTSGEKIIVDVELTETFLRAKSKSSERIIFLEHISSLNFKKEQRLKYLSSGILLFLISLLLIVGYYFMGDAIIKPFSILGISKKIAEAIVILLGVIFVISGFTSLLVWIFSRCYILTIYQY